MTVPPGAIGYFRLLVEEKQVRIEVHRDLRSQTGVTAHTRGKQRLMTTIATSSSFATAASIAALSALAVFNSLITTPCASIAFSSSAPSDILGSFCSLVVALCLGDLLLEISLGSPICPFCGKIIRRITVVP